MLCSTFLESLVSVGLCLGDKLTAVMMPVVMQIIYSTPITKLRISVYRDEAQNKMLALKEKADKEMTQYNTELKELARIIDHDRKLREFMSRKDQERSEAHEEMEAMKRKREAEKSSEREGTVMVSSVWYNISKSSNIKYTYFCSPMNKRLSRSRRLLG